LPLTEHKMIAKLAIFPVTLLAPARPRPRCSLSATSQRLAHVRKLSISQIEGIEAITLAVCIADPIMRAVRAFAWAVRENS
jgi:hypothetical protein